jgi:hypothetical protein
MCLHLANLTELNEKARVLSGDEILLIASTRDRFHRCGVEQPVFDEALVNMNADDLTERDESRSGIAVNVVCIPARMAKL